MSLASFQRALCDLIASPDLCVRLTTDADSVLAPYELSARERRRLTEIVRQPGMSTTCTLYRVNRITPLYTLLPLTSFLLGERLLPEAESYWAEYPGSDLQFKYEVERFGRFLLARIRSGELDDPYLEEVLNFEVSAAALRYARSRDSDAELIRVVRFRHDPATLLELLAERRRPADNVAEGDFDVVLDARSADLELRIQTRVRGFKT